MHQGILQQFVEWVIHHGGLYVLLAIIFAETGLFVGFFFPGDSLLFAAGIYSADLAATFYHVHYVIIVLLLIAASTLGSLVGYWFGYKTGPRIFNWKDTFLFKKKYLLKAKGFFERYGRSTVFMSKFLPVLRTFAPIVAGVVKMQRASFVLYNILGSFCWVTLMFLAGHFLQSIFYNKYGYSLKDHIELMTIIIVVVTTLPVLYKMLFSKTTTLPAA